jgi:hypothetical protein
MRDGWGEWWSGEGVPIVGQGLEEDALFKLQCNRWRLCLAEITRRETTLELGAPS